MVLNAGGPEGEPTGDKQTKGLSAQSLPVILTMILQPDPRV